MWRIKPLGWGIPVNACRLALLALPLALAAGPGRAQSVDERIRQAGNAEDDGRRGLIILQIDGLAHETLREALDRPRTQARQG